MSKPYIELLKDPRWQKKRLLILARDEWRCQECFDDRSTLHVHHRRYTGSKPWEAPDEDLVTLCEGCHALITALAKEAKRLIDEADAWDLWRAIGFLHARNLSLGKIDSLTVRSLAEADGIGAAFHTSGPAIDLQAVRNGGSITLAEVREIRDRSRARDRELA